jgi:hypothetical protein
VSRGLATRKNSRPMHDRKSVDMAEEREKFDAALRA